MPRPIRAVLNTHLIAYNLELIQKINPSWQCMPVLKANAYGHGVTRILSGLQAAHRLAVLEIEKAVQLRQQGWEKPIVLLEGCFDRADIACALEHKLDWVLHSPAQLEALTQYTQAPPSFEHTPCLFLKLNTGMNRLGFTLSQAPQAIARLNALVAQNAWPTPVLMTHFANADTHNDSPQAPSPHAQHAALMALKPANWLSSLGNSAGVLNYPELSGNIVRPGIALYGATPGPKPASEYGLKPAMSLCSEIIAIQHVPAGQRVGYGSRWQAKKTSTIAVLACGYADGYPRHAPDGTPTWVHGQIAPLVGRVSMDMLTVDVSHIPEAQVGSPVELWGQHLPVDTLAAHCGTIGYELLCAVTERVPFDLMPPLNT